MRGQERFYRIYCLIIVVGANMKFSPRTYFYFEVRTMISKHIAIIIILFLDYTIFRNASFFHTYKSSNLGLIMKIRHRASFSFDFTHSTC